MTDLVGELRKHYTPSKDLECSKCGYHSNDEYYMVKDKVFLSATHNLREHSDCFRFIEGTGENSLYVQNIFLCVGCLEEDLGRSLTRDDFDMDILVNIISLTAGSNRLRNILDDPSQEPVFIVDMPSMLGNQALIKPVDTWLASKSSTTALTNEGFKPDESIDISFKEIETPPYVKKALELLNSGKN